MPRPSSKKSTKPTGYQIVTHSILRPSRRWFLEHGAYADIGRHAPHIGNVRNALEWSFPRGSHATGIELAADAAPLFLGLWLLVECRRWSELALKMLVEFDELSHREARLQEAYAVSSMHTLGNTPEVQKAIQRGLELHQAGEETLPQLRLLAGLNLFPDEARRF